MDTLEQLLIGWKKTKCSLCITSVWLPNKCMKNLPSVNWGSRDGNMCLRSPQVTQLPLVARVVFVVPP